MGTACFIPIKANSARVKGKNFRQVGGIPLYKIIIDKAIAAGCFDAVFVDTNSEEIAGYVEHAGALLIQRRPDLAENTANGNDLLVHHFTIKPDYDAYFQLFATAPLMKVQTIRDCVEKLALTAEHDSIFTAISHHGFFWWNNQPVNYLPNVLPRSQDLVPVMEETTGLYGINAASLRRLRARIGARPIIHYVSKTEAIDLNTEDDFHYANWLVEKGISSVEPGL